MDLRRKSIKTQLSGWIFQRINSMKISFHKSGELNGSSYVKVSLRSSTNLIIKKGDGEFCFNWSFLAHLRPCKNIHSNRVSN